MSKIFTAYANRKNLPLDSLRFHCDGVRIKPDQTPKMLEMEDQDQIDAYLAQTGGEWR
jgi:small ubiquitin-related modifier